MIRPLFLLVSAGLLASASGALLTPEVISGLTLHLPQPGDNALLILSPSVLALERINTKPSQTAPVDSWDFATDKGELHLPEAEKLRVLIDGQPAKIEALGFRRRPIYAPLTVRDLRIENALYLKLAKPVASGQKVVVENPDGSLWPATMAFKAAADPDRFNPALHINEEGYTPDQPKEAMVGAFLGSMGELEIGPRAFSVVDAATGKSAFSGTLAPRAEKGWGTNPSPYQQVFEADFSALNTPGTYRLRVEGFGASEPFALEAGVALGHARAYELGLYHQRCGMANVLPFTRFTRDACHTAPAEVPVPQSAFPKAWLNIGSANADATKNPRHTAPRLVSEETMLYPYVRKGKVDVSGGHHDAGDYSKYTINCAMLVEALTISADAFPGVGALDNLGIPESGDGKSDLLQEAKWEADFLLKMQDSDGGFYFLVYPRDRKYEGNVTPDHGDSQVVFPKTTASTASATAALAELGSSPLFRKQFPAEADRYLKAAKAGWAFLQKAIADHGKDGSYQTITHYGNFFLHDDELAWAACALFVATGDEAYHTQLKDWYDPAAKDTRKWTWVRCWEGYGCAARLYAFAARTGRLPAAKLDPAYLAKCEAELIAAGDEQTARSRDCAYGTSYPAESKRFRSAGWYFSGNNAFEIAFADLLHPKPEYLQAMVANLNYEDGCNPVNAAYITGQGGRPQRDIVNQYAQNDRRVLPPSGMPLGNISAGFHALPPYGRELGPVDFPNDGIKESPYPMYDRWGDSFNVSNEAVVVDQGRGLGAAALLAARTPLAKQPWKAVPAQIVVPKGDHPRRHRRHRFAPGPGRRSGESHHHLGSGRRGAGLRGRQLHLHARGRAGSRLDRSRSPVARRPPRLRPGHADRETVVGRGPG